MAVSPTRPQARTEAAGDPPAGPARPPARVDPPRVQAWAGGTAALTYALWTEPSPLTVSLPGVPERSGTLQLLVTNPFSTPVEVAAIGVTLQMGEDAADLGLTTQGTGFSVSDGVNWTVTAPSGVVQSGPATWVVGPKTGGSVSLPGRASITVQITGLPVNQAVGTTAVAIVEALSDGTRGETAFDLTKFPYAFYFERLVATVQSGSVPVAVAQVANGTAPPPVVKLTWSCSVTEPSAFTVLYTGAGGQRTGTVTTPGEYVVPEPLTCDTVFVVQVNVTGPGGQSLPFTLATAVSVQNPDLGARSLSLNAEGEVSVDAVNVPGGRFAILTNGNVGIRNPSPYYTLDVKGTVSGNALVSGGGDGTTGLATGKGQNVRFELGTAGANLSVGAPGEVRIDAEGVVGGRLRIMSDGKVGINKTNPQATLDVAGAVSLGDTSTGALNVSGGATVKGGDLNGDSAVITYLRAGSWESDQPLANHAFRADSYGPWATALFTNSGGVGAIYAENNSASFPTLALQNDAGGPTKNVEAWSVCTNGRIGSTAGVAHLTQVATRGGPRTATSPLSLRVEVQACGTGRLSGGRAQVAFDDAFADLVVPDGGYRVLATPLGACGGLHVAAKEARGFRVESGHPDAAVEFDWLVVAPKRSRLDSAEPHELPAEFPPMPAAAPGPGSPT